MKICSVDFETKSAADLRKTGVYVYASDPSTDVWCMAYSWDGEDVRVWSPGDPIDTELEDWIVEGGKLQAWNAQFERVIWNTIMAPRYNWPRTKSGQWFCTMAQASTAGLPRALGQAAAVLGVEEQKDKAGQALMMRMARPRRTAADGTHVWWNTPDKIEALVDYCRQDVRTEMDVSTHIPYLTDSERQLYLLDQRINDRGVLLDRDLLDRVRILANESKAEIDAEINRLTRGEVRSCTNGMHLVAWLRKYGVLTSSVDKQAVAEILASPDLHPVIRRVLELRQAGAKSSTAKLNAMECAASTDGRMRGLLVYHGAATGRWSGKLVQPQNFPRPARKQAELDEIITKLKAGESIADHGHGTEIAADLLRSMLIAAPDHRLMFADYSAIEARVLAWVAGQKDLVETFAKGGDVYIKMAAAIYGVAEDKVTPEQRQVGKMAILGCFEEDTLVLTPSGWKPIVNLTTQDQVWDGEEWVTHQGVVYQGYKEVHRMNGIGATPDHGILTEHGWREWQEVHTNPSLFRSALSSAKLPSSNGLTTNEHGTLSAVVRAVGKGLSCATAYLAERLPAATYVVARNPLKPASTIGATPILYPTTPIGRDCLTAYPPVFSVAKTLGTPSGTTTASGEYGSTQIGSKIAEHFYRTLSLWTDGTIRYWNWIVSTTTAATNRVTFALSHAARTLITGGLFRKCNRSSSHSKRKSHVYDVSYAGPRNRFTILTDSGPIIVHNCGYGMGGKRFAEQCATMGIAVDVEEAQRIVAIYRQENNRIAAYWRDIEAEFLQLTSEALEQGETIVRLPLRSGRSLTYRNPRIVQRATPWGTPQDIVEIDTLNSVTRQWVTQKVWGGLLVENVVQATARDLMAGAMMRLEQKGYPVIMSVHDEIICEVPDGFGSLDEMIQIMTAPPAWAKGCPIAAEGKEGPRYRK